MIHSRFRYPERAKQHANGEKHNLNLKHQRQPSVVTLFDKQETVLDEIEELTEGLLSADIPLFKLEVKKLRKVLEKKFGPIPSARHLEIKIRPKVFDR